MSFPKGPVQASKPFDAISEFSQIARLIAIEAEKIERHFLAYAWAASVGNGRIDLFWRNL